MKNDSYLQLQVMELERLLEKSADNPILGPQLRDRLDEAKRLLAAEKQVPGKLLPRESPALPRAAIFFRGEGVQDSDGILAGLAGEALIDYEKMFVAQSLHEERIAAKATGRQRRPRGTPKPGLLFTGTPRGSFGLEFVPQFHDDSLLLDVHAKALTNVADVLASVVESNEQSVNEVLEKVPPGVLKPLQHFLKTLAEYKAELRLAAPGHRARSLTASRVKAAAELFARDVEQDIVDVTGEFRGVTLDSGHFDFRSDDESSITGTVADQLAEEDLERIGRLTTQRCEARLQKTIVRTAGGPERTIYVLLDAQPSAQPDD